MNGEKRPIMKAIEVGHITDLKVKKLLPFDRTEARPAKLVYPELLRTERKLLGKGKAGCFAAGFCEHRRALAQLCVPPLKSCRGTRFKSVIFSSSAAQERFAWVEGVLLPEFWNPTCSDAEVWRNPET
jgi:hypothetical protein